jgi:hypothetical protein
MSRRLLALLLLCACTQTRNVSLTFGSDGEGLDGFLCKDNAGAYLLQRARRPDGTALTTSLVIDFVRLGGVPGCRTGQLVKWCATHACTPIESRRSCVSVTLPTDTSPPREDLRAAVLAAMRRADATGITPDAPDEFVLVRALGTTQSCDELAQAASGALPPFDATKLIGCAYSCPVLFDKVDQDVYLGFETLTAQCEQGVRICADGELHWEP